MAERSAVVVTLYYWPEPIGSAPYLTDIGEWLAAEGYAVRVFTCRPHYPDGYVREGYRGGRRDTEARNGVLIERVAPWQPQRRGALGRMMREGAFLAQGLWALLRRRIRRADLVVSLCPSIMAVLLGAALRAPDGRHVAVVHDIQSGLASGLGMVGGGFVAGLMRRLERAALDRADLVLVLSENMEARLRAQGVAAPIEILPIWVDTGRIRPLEPPRDEPVTAVYSGNLGRKQGLGQIIDMAERLERRGSPVQVVVRGDGSEAARLADEAGRRGLRVRFAPLVPPERLPECLAEGTIHLVPQDPNTADFAVPSKAYSIMASGRPFVAAARPGSQLWALREQSQAFLCVPAGDADALADAVERLARDPALCRELGDNGRRYAVQNHDKALVLGHFHSLAANEAADGSWRLHPSRIS